MQLLLGFFLSTLIGVLAWRAGSLNRSGALAAVISGGLIFGLGGVPWAVLLLAFFLTSSVLSRAFIKRKLTLSEKYAKGSQRDWGQVLANGGVGALLVIAYAFSPDELFWVAYVGSMAAVTADTWATELGVLSPTLPRLVTTGKAVERGTSGAVSLVGSLAALGGALLITLSAVVLTPSHSPGSMSALAFILTTTTAGLFGSLFDSLLGATYQMIYYCPVCRKETERHPLHTCGAATIPLRGWRWLNNDIVNLICSMSGSLIALFFWGVIQ